MNFVGNEAQSALETESVGRQRFGSLTNGVFWDVTPYGPCEKQH
jgi:hypothetical protein